MKKMILTAVMLLIGANLFASTAPFPGMTGSTASGALTAPLPKMTGSTPSGPAPSGYYGGGIDVNRDRDLTRQQQQIIYGQSLPAVTQVPR